MNQFSSNHHPPKFTIQHVPVPGQEKASFWGDVAQLAKQTTGTLTNLAGGVPKVLALGLSRVMPEVIIPIYILPCSSDTNEYKCYIDCEDIALRLNAGILVRPKLEVWVGHTDINRSYLAQVIRREFATQLDAARNKVKNQQLTPKMQDELSQQRDKLAEQSQSRITTAALSGGIIFLLTTGPWVTLFLTMMAVSSGVQGISDALELLSLNQEIKQGKQGNLQAQQKLEQKLAAGGRRFVRAVSQLKLKTHPTLQCLAAAFCQIDGCSSSFSPPCKDPAPNLTHFLNSRDYQQSLTPSYILVLRQFLAQKF